MKAESGSRTDDEAPLRICFVSSQYPPLAAGGIGRFTSDLARGFASAGHDVHVVTTSGGWPAQELVEGVWVHRVARRSSKVITAEGAASEFLENLALVYRAVLRLHQERAFDIVSSPVWQAEGLLVAWDARFTSVVSLHTSTRTLIDLKQVTEADLGFLPVLESLCVAAHAHTHANSRAAVAKITAEYSSPNGVVVLPHGVRDHSEKFSRQRRYEDRVRILVVGQQEERKGTDILARIIPRLLSDLPAIEFVFAGEQWPLPSLGSKTLQRWLAGKLKPKALSRIQFAGKISDRELYQHYADADMLLMPSRYESFGLPLIEAMSFGIAVVAARAGGVSEVVVENETGILVDVDDEAGLIEAVKNLVANADLRQKYGREGRRRYLSHYSTAVSVPRVIAAYRQIVRTDDIRNAPAAVSDPGIVEKFAGIIQRLTPMTGDAATLAAKTLIERESSGPPSGVPKVSVIVTCFNYANYVTEALNSVAAQTHANFECVVVDDASTDGSAEAIAGWIARSGDGRFRLIRNRENLGQMGGFAVGLQATSGDFVAFLDADDFWFERYLEHHANVLQNADKPAATSCSDLLQIDQDGRVISGCFTGERRPIQHDLMPLYPEDIATGFDPGYLGSADVQFRSPRLVVGTWNVTSGIVFRRSTLEAVMPADPRKLRLCADGYLFSLCHSIAGTYWTSAALGAYRRHGKNGYGFLPLVGTRFISSEESSTKYQNTVLQEVLARLLDRGRSLDALLPAGRRERLVREVFRALLAIGAPVDKRPIAAVVGWSRVSRDWLKSRLLRFRQPVNERSQAALTR